MSSRPRCPLKYRCASTHMRFTMGLVLRPGTRVVLGVLALVLLRPELQRHDVTRLAAQTPAAPVFEIVARHSGKCLDVERASQNDVAAIIQWTCHGGDNQRWRLEPAPDGGVFLVAVHS